MDDNLNVSRRKRKAFVRKYLADVLTDNLEDAFLENVLSRDEVNEIYRKMSRQLGMWDLVGRRRICPPDHPEEVKAAIRARLSKYNGAIVQSFDARATQPRKVVEMSHNAITVIRNSGASVPDDYLAKLMSDHKLVGAALANGSCVETAKSTDPSDPERMKTSILENPDFKEATILLSFQREASNPEDIQPLTLLKDDEGNSTLVVFMSGDLSEYERASSSRRPESFAAEDLADLMRKLYAASGNDFKKMFDELQSDAFTTRNICNMMLGSEGTITLLSADNEVLHFTIQGDTSHKQFDWGWVSNHLGIGVEAPKVEEKKSGLAGAFKNLMGGSLPKGNTTSVPKVVATGTPATKPVVEPNKIGEYPDKSGTENKPTPTVSPDEILTVNVPSLFKNPGKRRKWFEQHIPSGGPLPKDWAVAKTLSCSRATANQQFMKTYISQNGLAATADALKAQQTAINTVQQNVTNGTGKPVLTLPKDVQKEVVNLKKDTVAHSVAPPATKGMTADPIPVISPNQKTKLLEVISNVEFKEAVDRNSQLMSDPKKWSELEDKIPSLPNQLGIEDLETTLAWGFPELMKLSGVSPESVAILTLNWRAEAMQWKHLADSLLAEQEKNKTVTETQPQKKKFVL